MKKGTRFLYAEEMVNYLSYGLMVFGFLPLLNTFLAAPTAKIIKKSRRLTALLSALSARLDSVSGAISKSSDSASSISLISYQIMYSFRLLECLPVLWSVLSLNRRALLMRSKATARSGQRAFTASWLNGLPRFLYSPFLSPESYKASVYLKYNNRSKKHK